MLNLLLFIALNSLVFTGAALVVRCGLRMTNRLAVAIATALLGWLVIVVGLEMLAIFGQIRLIPAAVLAVASLATGLFVCITCRRREGDSTIDVANFPPTPHVLESGGQHWVNRWALLLVGAMTLWATLDVLIANLCGPVLPVSDAPIYHLYFPVRWWQSGRLELAPTPFGESAAPYFPANANVWFTWLLLPWSSELAAKVGQWPFLWIAMGSVFGLARELGVCRPAAGLAAALWGTGTLPVLNSGFADVDLVLAAWYLVATWFLVRYARDHKPADLICCSLSMGAALGTKTIAVLFVPILLLSAAVVTWKRARRWSHGALLLFGVTVPAGFWYIRNTLLTGNPLYPLDQEVFGFPALHGWYRREALLTSDYHIPTTNWQALLLLLLRGLDPVLVPFWIAGVAAAVLAARRDRILPLFVVGVGVLHIALFWWVNPYQTQDRFLFAAFGLLAVPVALLFERIPWLSIPFAALLAWHVIVGPYPLLEWCRVLTGMDLSKGLWPPLLPAPLNVIAETWMATFSNQVILGRMALFVAVLLASMLGSVAIKSTNRKVGWACVCAVVMASGIAFRTYSSWIPEKFARLRFIPFAPQIGYTGGWLALEDLSKRPLRVAYAGTNLPFYLFGSRLQNQVRYVNINRYGDYLMHDYHRLFVSRGEPLATSSTPDWDRREADEGAWLQNMRDQRIDLLFVGLVNRAGGKHNVNDEAGFPIERTWADRHPELFQQIHADAATRLYAVSPATGTSP
jgi:hypothetical protein